MKRLTNLNDYIKSGRRAGVQAKFLFLPPGWSGQGSVPRRLWLTQPRPPEERLSDMPKFRKTQTCLSLGRLSNMTNFRKTLRHV